MKTLWQYAVRWVIGPLSFVITMICGLVLLTCVAPLLIIATVFRVQHRSAWKRHKHRLFRSPPPNSNN